MDAPQAATKPSITIFVPNLSELSLGLFSIDRAHTTYVSVFLFFLRRILFTYEFSVKLLGITTFVAGAEPHRNMSGPQTRSPYLAGSQYQAGYDLKKREGFLVTRVGIVGTSYSTDDLEKREDFLATNVGTIGTSSSTNCTYRLSNKKREEESISWTRYWYVRRSMYARSLIGIGTGTWYVSIPGGRCLTSPLTKCDHP